MVTLDVPRRQSGRMTSTVLVIARHAGDDYLVSMLGDGVDWVRNARAAGGRVVIRHGRAQACQLEEVDVEKRGADPASLPTARARRETALSDRAGCDGRGVR